MSMSVTTSPTLTVSCNTHGKNVTHVHLTMYPRTLFIQYGAFNGDCFNVDSCEVLPIVMHPELADLHDGERWVLDEVHMMFINVDGPEFAEAG